MLQLVLLATLTLVVPQSATPVEVVDAFHAALDAGDREAALAQLAEEVVIFESGGAEMSREEYAGHHLGGDIVFSAAVDREIIDRRHEVVGQIAHVLSRTRTTGTFRDREIDSTGVETMILQRREATWKIVHIHWSSR